VKIKYTLQILLLLVQICFAQTGNIRELRGKISADSLSVDRITIENVTTDKTVFRTARFLYIGKGRWCFSFTAVHLEGLRRRINQEDFY
jgi:hypothetical protein